MDTILYITTFDIIFENLIYQGLDMQNAELKINQLYNSFCLCEDKRFYYISGNFITTEQFKNELEREYNIQFIPIKLG